MPMRVDMADTHAPWQIDITSITADHIEGYHHALDTVARERKYLTMFEAFPLPQTRDFVLGMIEQRNPHMVAVAADRVVGWCDISRHFFPSHAHRGSLGMGIIPEFRGKGIGHRLMIAALDKAREEGFLRVELSVRSDNTNAIALYEKVGFVKEGLLKRSVCVDGQFSDTICMAILLDGA